MQNFNFDFGDRVCEVFDLRCVFRIYTDENVYTPDPSQLSIIQEGNSFIVKSDQFASAGLFHQVSGSFQARFTKEDDEIRCDIEAHMEERIKGSVVRLIGVPKGKLCEKYMRFRKADIQKNSGWCRHYPNPLFFPVGLIQCEDDSYFYAISDDREIREKVFEVQDSDDGWTMDLHHVEDARKWGQHHRTPTWRIGQTKNEDQIFKPRINILKQNWGAKEWDRRSDVPDWARKIALVLNLHAMHWTGYIYNSYEDQLEALKTLSNMLPGEHILAYLPSWDGRYNYNWPQYEANQDLGGESGLKKLVDGAHALGIRVIPQYGAVSANRKYLPPGLHDAASRDGYGNQYVKGVDWDGDRMPDSYRVNANIGDPSFRQFILDKVVQNMEKYNFDGTFMDITQTFHNDPRCHITEGHLAFTQYLKEQYSDHLLFGEEIYDGLMGAYPLCHSSASNFESFNSYYEDYNRVTYHLYHPAPTGSTGVYETGYQEPFLPDPEENIIPCLAIVNDTMKNNMPEVRKHIEISKAYLNRKNI